MDSSAQITQSCGNSSQVSSCTRQICRRSSGLNQERVFLQGAETRCTNADPICCSFSKRAMIPFRKTAPFEIGLNIAMKTYTA